MKVLVISLESWRDDKGGGNVLSNIFEDTGFEFAQIFCSQESPSNNLCDKYFKLSDSMILNSVLKGAKAGEIFRLSEQSHFQNESINLQVNVNKENRLISVVKRYHWNVLHLAREILWKISKIDHDSLEKFIKEFNPDIIFAPCYSSHYMLRLTRIVHEIVNKVPIISYISDDNYTYNQFSLSPLFWVNRFFIRRSIRRTSKLYSFMYTMIEEQKEEIERDLNVKCKILRKSANISSFPSLNKTHEPIRMIYAGGLYLNRWKILYRLVEEINRIDNSGYTFVLNIYTGTSIPEYANDFLNNKKTSFINPLVTKEELNSKYQESDIALHVESFDLANRLKTRLSFSTKIVDCLQSGCAIMAIGDKKQAGINYLKRNDAAICINDLNELHKQLINILNSRETIDYYAKQAYICAKNNHSKKSNLDMVISDFERTVRISNE